MAREQRIQKRKSVTQTLPLKKRNYQILGIALVCIAAGYVALVQEPWDGFMALVVAPALLVLGYCILVPIAILYRGDSANSDAGGDEGMEKTQASA